MKKICSLFLSLLMLAGCSRQNDPVSSSSLGTSSVPAVSSSTAAPAAPEEKKVLSLQYQNPYNGTSSGKGFYRIDTTDDAETGDTRMNVMFFDYASRKKIFLCNKPNCRHSDETCTSYLNATEFNSNSLLYFEEKLYLFSTQFDGMSAAPSDGGGAPLISSSSGEACIVRMNPDGSGRETFLTLPSGIAAQAPYITGENCLYFYAEQTSMRDNGDGSHTQIVEKSSLMKADLKSGKLEEALPLPRGKEFYQVIGAYDNKLVVLKTVYPKNPDDLPPNDDSAFRAMLPNSTLSLITIDIDTKEEATHFTGGLNDMSYYTCDGSMVYYADATGASLYTLNLKTDETATLTDKLPRAKPVLANRVYDGKLLLTYYEDKYQNAQPEESYWIDTSTGEMKRHNLMIAKPKGPVSILDATGDAYLVISDYDAKDEYLAAFGVTQTEILDTHYALIAKEDYWNAKAEYLPFERIQ